MDTYKIIDTIDMDATLECAKDHYATLSRSEPCTYAPLYRTETDKVFLLPIVYRIETGFAAQVQCSNNLVIHVGVYPDVWQAAFAAHDRAFQLMETDGAEFYDDDE